MSSAVCLCENYQSPLTTFEEMQKRCGASTSIMETLDARACGSDGWFSVLQCRECGSFWALDYPFGAMHGGGPPCLYRIEMGADEPSKWLLSHDPVASKLSKQHELQLADQELLRAMGPEVGPDRCNHTNCDHLRVKYSSKCREHHFEMISGRSYSEAVR